MCAKNPNCQWQFFWNKKKIQIIQYCKEINICHHIKSLWDFQYATTKVVALFWWIYRISQMNCYGIKEICHYPTSTLRCKHSLISQYYLSVIYYRKPFFTLLCYFGKFFIGGWVLILVEQCKRSTNNVKEIYQCGPRTLSRLWILSAISLFIITSTKFCWRELVKKLKYFCQNYFLY